MSTPRSSASSASSRTWVSSPRNRVYVSPVAPEPDISEQIVELKELTVRPGTYFNPQTEVVVVVDDSASIDQTVFNMEAYEGADWVRISDEVPLDEQARDELFESFQTHYHPGASGAEPDAALEPGEDGRAEDEGADEPEPDPDPDERDHPVEEE